MTFIYPSHTMLLPSLNELTWLIVSQCAHHLKLWPRWCPIILPLMIHVTFVGLLVLYNTSLLFTSIFRIVVIMCLNLCILLLLCIQKWFVISYNMSKKLLQVSTLLKTLHLIFFPFLMQIRQVVLPLGTLPLTIVSFLAEILSHGVQRNNQQFLTPRLKLNMRPWKTL